MKITHASVFSGIGGPEVAATMLGWTNLFHCEINEFGRKILDYHYPDSESYEDITKTDFTKWRGKVNVLTGGFPCQPFSYAGKRGGADDDRYLWPHMFRCIDEIRPDWVVAENVAGILTMVEQGEVSQMASAPSLFAEADDIQRYQQRSTFTLERICRDLETHGYTVQPILIPACAVGAPHRRDRVFIIANANSCADGRDSRKDESESRAQRLQERHEIRQSDKPSEIRREDSEDAIAHTAGRGEGAPRQSGSVESNGCNENQQPSEWGAATEWSDRFYAVLRHAADTHSSRGQEIHQYLQSKLADGQEPFSNGGQLDASDTSSKRLQGADESSCQEERERMYLWRDSARCGETIDGNINSSHTSYSGLQEARTEQPTATTGRTGLRTGEWFEELEGSGEDCGRWTNFPTVSPVHRGNDGIPFNVDDLTISFSKWRTESLKAYGNAIVPQVMYEIFRAIEMTYNPPA